MKDDVCVSTQQKDTTVKKMIWNMTSSGKIGYYFNSLRRLDMVPPEQRPQLSSGTSAVAKMNEQTNKKFRNIPELYQSTLELNCYAFSFLKLFSHNCAEYCPTDITVSQQTVLSHNLSVFQFTQAEWQSVLLTKTKLMEKRCEHKERIRKKPTARLIGTKKLAVVSKRPAAVILKHGIRRKVIKRHTFNKRRVS